MSEAIATTITRRRFRELIDPLLDGLGTHANDIESCSFDSYGFKLVVFERDEDGHKFATSEGLAKQTVRVAISRDEVSP